MDPHEFICFNLMWEKKKKNLASEVQYLTLGRVSIIYCFMRLNQG